ncbi:MAG TPA: ABC-ATPase domain-containing protein, partial [Longimicrobiales bacterium]|nr:ABC-ATPase domain-containing protein [Longimicrobiales bacterium]
YASPSRVRALLPPATTALPPSLLATRSRRLGVASHLARVFHDAATSASSSLGSGKGGLIRMEDPGQQVMPQTAVRVDGEGAVEARFYVGLPARGRRVMGGAAAELLCETVPALVRGTLRAGSHPPEALRTAAETNEDADRLRAALPELGLVAFVADGARLPRRSGVDDRPLEAGHVVPFESPEELRVAVDVPNAGRVTGMGVPSGVTLVVGGGFHGKSTLLRALERGVWNHRPGDGRERVVSEPGTVKVRAEDGRSVVGVDISAFIDGLPLGADTRHFTTPDASGSTSQAATLMESVEAGATTLLVDEDTAATNFMIRDRRMQELVPGDAEPITPFVDRIRDLHRAWGVSSVLVLGGSGDYLDVADTVVAMRDYRPRDVTRTAREIARAHPTGRRREAGPTLGSRPARVLRPASVDPRRGRRDVSVKVRDGGLLFGTGRVDLSAVEQIVSPAQLRAVGRAMVLAGRRFLDGRRTLPEVLDLVMEAVEGAGLDVLDSRQPGDLHAFRRHELAAALARLRTLAVVRTP